MQIIVSQCFTFEAENKFSKFGLHTVDLTHKLAKVVAFYLDGQPNNAFHLERTTTKPPVKAIGYTAIPDCLSFSGGNAH
jgi:hypothetical protein